MANARQLMAARSAMNKSVADTKIPNVVRYGNIVVNDGIVSGFDVGNYIELPDEYTVKSNVSMMVRFMCSNFVPYIGAQCLFATVYNNGTQYFDLASVNYQLLVNSSSEIRCWPHYNWSAEVSRSRLMTNKWYWMRYSATGQKWIASYSEDGLSWVDAIEADNTNIPLLVGHKIVIGCNRLCKDQSATNQGAAFAKNCKFDLNSCELNIDGATVWKGMR